MTYITGLSTQSPQVWVALLNGSSPFDLGPASSALISPNGSFVAAVSKGQTNKASTLSVYATGGGAAAVVVNSPQFMQLPVGAWSSDSKLILVAVGASPADLDVVDVATGKSRTIATGVIYGASFAPGTADNVVYARGAPNKTPVNLYTTTATGAGTRQLTHDGASVEPLWGARGIVYSDESARAKTHTAAAAAVADQPRRQRRAAAHQHRHQVGLGGPDADRDLRRWRAPAGQPRRPPGLQRHRGLHGRPEREEAAPRSHRPGQRLHRRRDLLRRQMRPGDEGHGKQPRVLLGRAGAVDGGKPTTLVKQGGVRELEPSGLLAHASGQRPVRSNWRRARSSASRALSPSTPTR